MKLLITAVFVTVQVTGLLAFDPKCPFPRSLWCTSFKIASVCGVTRQCMRTEWSPVRDAAPLVNFTLYYESLCPGCRGFINYQLYRAFKTIGGIFNLALVPYGNAQEKKVGDKWVFSCQHGKQECIGNILEACLLNIVNDVKKSFPFIHCMEVSGNRSEMTSFRECSKKFPSIPADKVEQCAYSKQGNEWEHEMGVKTKALNPPHQYVPWVTLNGVHNEKIQNKADSDLIKLLCDTYTGPKPRGCQKM